MSVGQVLEKTSVLEVLDKLLDKGVVTRGDVVLSLADVDLVTLKLAAVLASTATLDRFSDGPPMWRPSGEDRPEPTDRGQAGFVTHEPPSIATGSAPEGAPRISMDSKGADRGLARLALALVELLRRLMERQAVRRMTAGALSPVTCERLGLAFIGLDREMAELRSHFGFTEQDLNLDLGPVGKLI